VRDALKSGGTHRLPPPGNFGLAFPDLLAEQFHNGTPKGCRNRIWRFL
jgi:hypothetical protein